MTKLHDYERSPYGLGWEHARRKRPGAGPFPYNSRRDRDYQQGKADFRSRRYREAGEALRKLLGDQDHNFTFTSTEEFDT